MARNLVICCDGTSNEFGPANTNVVRLVQALDRDPARQHVYYDPGLGTLPEPGAFYRFQKQFSKLCGLAFGAGIEAKVGGAYRFLMDFWEPGDKVFLFGFSRGAYTVRVLAGLLHSLGLMPHGNHNLVPYAIRLYDAVRKEGTHREDRGRSSYWQLCDDFRWTFARRVHPDDDTRHFPVHFLGVWDTVSSVGWAWDPKKFPYTFHNPSVGIIRHAVSLDERRWFFRQNLMAATGAKKLKQRWFAGSHGDIGGGYAEDDGGLWRVAFEWMLEEARAAGMLVSPHRFDAVLNRTPPPQGPAWNEPLQESLVGLWWLAEFYPKWPWHRGSASCLPSLGLGRHRFVPEGAEINRSTLLRIRTDLNYNPPNLSKAFLKKVRALSEVPEMLPYSAQARAE